MRESVSACLIVLDEEVRLPAALASVAFCDEVVVVDGGSTDRTRELAAAAGARVVENAWPGYAAQRNVAIEAATSDWILEVDADERVSTALRAEIEAFLADPPAGFDLAALPIRDVFLGRPLGPSARYPAYRYRLFRKAVYRHEERRTVHEGLWPSGPVWPFSGDLEHVLAGSFREAVSDAVAYARLEASQLDARLTPLTFVRGALVRPAVKLVYRAAIEGAWRDGWRGLAKIGLDSASDSLVWTMQLARAARGEGGSGGTAGHFADEAPARGPVKIVGVAVTAEGTRAAERWLAAAAGSGADVALVSARSRAAAVRARPPASRGLLGVVRALAAERQLRPYDAVAAFDRPARALAAWLPAHLRGRVRPLASPADAAQVTAWLAARTRVRPEPQPAAAAGDRGSRP